MKKILFFFLFLVICLVPKQVLAFNTVKPTDNFYVNDYANILSSNTENYIMEHSVSLANQTKAQIVVVTVPNLGGASLEEYATALFRKFGIGDKEENNGLLLLLALEERQMRVEVGYGLEGILPDGKTGRFQDNYMIPYFKEDNFDEGMLNGYKAFFQEVANYYEFDGEIDSPVEDEMSGEDIIVFIIILVWLFCFSILVILFVNLNNKNGSGGQGGIYFGGSSSGGRSSRGSSSRGFSGRRGSSGGGGSSRGF